MKKTFTTSSFISTRLLVLLGIVLSSASVHQIQAQISGVKNIPGDYADLAAAITDLNAQGVGAGGVTLNLLAGNPQTAPAGGYSITTLTGTAADQITLSGNGNAITASAAHTVGALNDAVFKIIGADWVTIQGFVMEENPANTVTTAGTNTMTEWGVALLYATTTNGAQNCTIQNNSISLNRTYQNTFGIYSNSTHSATVVTTTATATSAAGGNSNLRVRANSISNVNLGIVVVGPTAAADHNVNMTIGGNAPADGNTITNYGTTGTFSGYVNVSGTVNGVLMRNSTTYNISHNTIESSNGGTISGTLRGIFIPLFSVAPTGTFTNNINNNNISVRSAVSTGAMNGILVEGTTGNATSTLNVNNNDFQTITHTTATASGTITLIQNSMAFLTTSINNNTFTNLNVNTTGSVTFISNTITGPAGGSKNVNNNAVVTGFTKTGAGGTVTFFTDNGSDVAGFINNSNDNNFSNITVTGATAVTGISNTNGGSPTKTVSNNTVSNITGGTSAILGITINFDGGTTTATGNAVFNITGANTITGFSLGTSGAGTTNVSQNTIHSLNGSSTSAVTGLLCSGGTTRNLFRNKVYNIQNTNASGAAHGITVSSGTTITVHNNLIGDIRTPAANAANLLIGLNITGGTTINVFYNTVYLNGQSTGALFGSSAISVSTTPTVTLRNNIFVNNSTANGAGFTVAYRRSGTALGTYGATSNNNLFFASAPCTSSLIFYDGTNSDQTLAAFKARVAARDAASVTEDPNFISTSGASANFLHINTAISTQIESGATDIVGITVDFDGDARNATTPDIGADEFNGVAAVACAGVPSPGTASAVLSPICSGQTATICLSGQTPPSGIRIQWQSGPTAGGPFTDIACAGANCFTTGPLASGSYFYQAVVTCDNSGLTATSNVVTVVVNNPPTITITPNPATICNGTSVDLTASGGSTYTWSPATGLSGTTGAVVTASPNVTTVYTVIGVDIFGCTGTAAVPVNVLSSPVITSISATPATICSGENSQLSVAAPISLPIDAFALTNLSGQSYTTLAGGGITVINTNAQLTPTFGDATQDDGGVLISLPFTFNYLGNSFTEMSMSTNGWVAAGNYAAISALDSRTNGNFFSTVVPNNTFAAWFKDMGANFPLGAGSMRHGLIGTEVYAFQWDKAVGSGFSDNAAIQISFQVNVYGPGSSNPGRVEIIYGPTVGAIAFAAAIGIEDGVGGPTRFINALNGSNTSTATSTAWPGDGNGYRFDPVSLTYSWIPTTFLDNPNISNPLASNVTATTTYTVAVTSSNGCSSTASVTVNLDPQAFNVTGGGAYCQGGNGVPVGLDGSQVGVEYQLLRNGTDLGAPVGGTGASLDFGIQTLAGTYTVEATNLGNACTNTMNGLAVVTVNPLPAPIITATPNDSVCTPQNITLNAGAGYDTYIWSTGEMTQSITVNTSGNYGVTVTVAGCSGSASIGVTVSSSPSLSATLTQPSSCISNNGLINLTVSGTVGPFNYNWFTPNGSGLDNGVEDQDSLTVGTYQVTVTAPNGCTAAETYTLNGPGGCFDCPTISSLSATPDSACPNAVFTLLAVGLTDMGGTYGIQFKYSATALADPYVGGTVLATVPNAGLGGGGTSATAMASIPTSGNYFIYAILSPTPTDASCRPSQSIIYTIRDLPTPNISITENSGTTPNDGIICTGASATLTASGGTAYAWSTGAATAAINVTPAITTTYTVTVTANGGCTATASVTITVNSLPTPSIAVTETSGVANNDGIICTGASATLTASGGTSYAWSNGANTAAISVSPLVTTTYTVTVTNANGCTAVAMQTITVNALPSASILVTETSGIPNDGILCVGASATLTASGGTSYLWSTGAAIAAITVSPVITTTYTVTVTNANGCTATATRTITVNPLPTVFNVTGGGSVCNTDNVGVPVGLSGSQVGVNYQLLLNGNPVGAPVAGTGAAISFGNQLGIGTYTVVATNATTLCTNNMTGSVTITAFNCNIVISDPCVCLNNATTLTNGQFGETIKINAPNGQVWTVTAINGLFSQFSPLPPANPFPITVGTNLIMLGGNMYTLTGIHIDALGYTVTVSNGRGTILSIGNSCQYPNPSISTVFPSEICLNSDPIPLVGNPGDANIVSQTFRVNGVVTNVFDPAQGVGQYTILYTVNGGVPKAFGPNDPGCIQSVSTIVNVVATPSNLSCNDQVYVSLDASCTKAIGADDVLEGSFLCYDDYIVDVDKTIPLGNGPWVPAVFNASDIGKNYQVRVRHLVSGITCWGNLQVEDKLAPALVCENFEIPCNTPNLTPNYLVNTLGIPFAQPTATDCQTITWSYIDTEADEDCASGLFRTITRKWTAVDASGNSATCEQIISLLRPTPADLTLPPNYDGIDAPGFDCGAGTYPSPDWIEAQGLQGYPYVFGFPSGCNINWAYTDVPILICDGTYKVVREWTIVNWCVGTPFVHYQVIKISDEVGPQFACPANLTVATDPFTCCATINLPDVIVTDNCSRINNLSGMIVVRDQYTGDVINMVSIGGSLQDFPGNNWWDLDTLANFGWTPCLPVGAHTVMYIAEDDCGNTSACEFELNVRDLVPPVAACDETTTVAIGTDDPADCYTSADGCEFAGVTYVKASTFDDGSYDNCNDVRFTIRRMAPYSDCINGLNQSPCYPNGWSEFELATAELDSIKFYCCEVGTTQTIVLTVYQVDVNGNILVGLDGSPVRNECMIQVEVQDKLRPVCQAPAQVNVNCENFDPSLWAYGKAEITDNCCLDTSRVYQGQCGLTHTANYALFDTVCNKGTITRTFRAFDCHGQSSQCTQRVIVTYEQDYFVRFPNDVIVTQCDGTGVYGEPTFFGEDCELLGVSFEDEIFTVVPDACFKIERTWKIINWCTFDPNLPFIEVPNPNPNPVTNNPANLPGPIVSPLGTLAPWAPTSVRINPTDPQPTNYSTFYNKNANGYQYKQIIKIIDGQAPTGTFVVPDCSNQNWLTPNNSQLWNEMYWWDNGIQTHDLCEEPTELCITGTDACSGANVNIEYLLFLDLDGDGIMETVVNSVNTGIAGLGWNNVLYNNLNTPNFAGGTSRQFDERPVPANQKYGFTIQETVNGTNKTACVRWNTQQQQNNFVVPELPHGTHKIKWFITDGCGNNAEYEYTFTVKDCKAPTVVCLNGLSTNIMPTGMITLWASDFLQYTEDNCTPAGQIKIGIRKCGTGTGFPVDVNGNPITNVTFDCTELGSQCVELWAIDAAGNADYCETYLIVQDNLGSCVPGNLNVSGALQTESQEGIEEAVVNIIGTLPAPFSLTTLTNAQGMYQFAGIPQTATFAIAPEKDDNPLNGVTTYDLVLVSKHILGLEPLNSPYKMIAADANKSGSITTFDIVEIRKLILGIYTELPNNTSWRFVDKSFSFPNPNNPFQTLFPEVVTVTNAMVHQTGEDFTGVKIGDVNGSAVANALMQVDDRTVGTAIFDVSPSPNGAGSGDRDLKAGEIFELTFKAAQTLQGFQFTMLHSGLELLEVVNADGVNAQNFGQFEGKTTVSVDGAQAFTLQFRATKSGKLSQMLGVSGEITRAEGYPMITPQSPVTQSPITQSPVTQSPITQSPITQSPITKLGIAFRFDGKTISGVGFELYQNQPNPFVNKTFVGFHLPAAAEATLSVFDETGRVVYQQKGQFSKGENAISLDRALINTTGMLYYRLETATDSATKKMIQAK
jgi:hypothetical protein